MNKNTSFVASKRCFLAGALSVVTLACGTPPPAQSPDSTLAQDTRAAAQGFVSWCDSLQLNCTGGLQNVPNEVLLNYEDWQVLSSISLELLQSSSQLKLTPADLNDPKLLAAMKSLKLEQIHKSMLSRLDNLGWTGMTLANRRLDLSFKGPARLTGERGFSFDLSPASSLVFVSSDRVTATGMSLFLNASQELAPLSALQFTSPQELTLELATGAVSDVPQSFVAQAFLEGLLGTQLSAAQWTEPSREQSIASFYPLLSWLNQPSRSLNLQRRFFETTVNALSNLKQPDASLIAIMKALESVKTAQSGSGNVAVVTQRAGAKLACTINNGDLKMEFDSSFGLKSFAPGANGGVILEFYGIKASSNKTFGSFPIKRIEISPTEYTILDVPLLGKIAISWEDLEAQLEGLEVVSECRS